MNNFIEIDTLPVYDLQSELITMLNDGKIYWSKHNQICINSLPTDPDNFLAGSGSLQYNWSDGPVITQDGSEKYILEKIETPKKETDSTVISSTEPEIKMTEVEAWYTPQIPVSHGPGEYWGLPVLIFKVSSGNRTMMCSKIIMNPQEKIIIKAPDKGKEITKKEYQATIKAKMIEMRNNRGR